MKSPHWLRERVNDPYGTEFSHPLWTLYPPEVIGEWKIIERDGMWYGYKFTQSVWTTARATREEVVQMATGPQVDVWA